VEWGRENGDRDKGVREAPYMALNLIHQKYSTGVGSDMSGLKPDVSDDFRLSEVL
jgi:hypothetical protein